MERYVYRDEPKIREPIVNPIRAIVLDRMTGSYHLLNEEQGELVLNASLGKVGNTTSIETTQPFRVNLDLTTVEGNLNRIKLEGVTPLNVLSAPITVYSEIASRCNLNCRDCYQGKRPSPVTLVDREIFTLLERYSQLGIFIVRFTGKEPTTHPMLPDFIRYGTEIGLKMALNTNGVFTPGQRKDLIDAGIKEVVISIDGDREWNDYVRGKGVYEQATTNLRAFVAAGIDTRINMTVSRGNVEHIDHVAALAHSSGAYVSYIPMRNLGNATRRMREHLLTPDEMRQVATLITKLRRKYAPTRLLTYFDVVDRASDYYHPMFQMTPCHARKNIFMDNEGNVYPCDHLVNLGEIFRGGSIKSEDLLAIWRGGPGLVRYRNLEHSEGCKACIHFGKQCHGGCPSEYLVHSGGQVAEVTDRLCFYNNENCSV